MFLNTSHLHTHMCTFDYNSNANRMNFHDSALGNSFGEYSSGLLHGD